MTPLLALFDVDGTLLLTHDPLSSEAFLPTLRKLYEVDPPADAVAGDRAHRMQRMEVAELGRARHLLGNVTGLEAVDLVERDHDGGVEGEDALGDEAVARADPFPRGEDEEDRVDVVEALVDGALHAFRERVARALKTGKVGEHELVVVAVDDADDATAGGLRLVGDDRHLAPAERVDERGLPDVRPTHDRGETGSHGFIPPPGWGLLPAALYGERTPILRTCV